MTSSSSMDHRVLAIIGPDPEPLETLISNLMTSSNEQRSQAESLFNLCKKKYPNTIVKKLVHLLEHSPHLEARGMSAILLRNLFQQTDTVTSSITDPNTLVQDELPLWNSLLESTRSQVKSGLLNCVENEQDKSIIKILGHTISELAADNDWPELMDFLLDFVASEDSKLQESALLIFAQLAQHVGDSLVLHKTRLHRVFMSCLGNVGSADIRIAALSAVINFILCLENQIDKDRFRDLLPDMMQCVTEALNNVNEATAQKALVLLIELAGTEPSFFEGLLVEVVEGMLQIAETESLEEGTRHLAIEFVITLVEAWKPAPEMMREPDFISRLFAILMRMLLDIEDDAEWNSAENEDEDDAEWNSAENEDEDESSNYSVGKECVHRLATALGGNTIVPVAYDQLSKYLAAPEWQKHLAALVALAQIGDGCSKNEDLELVVTMVLNSFQDPHPRVRWAAINAIGQLSTYVGPSLQDQYQDRVLQALASTLDDVQNPRVKAHAFSTVLHFSSRCTPNILERNLVIVNKMVGLTETDPNVRVFNLVHLLEYSSDVEIRVKSVIELGEMFKEPLAGLTQHLIKDTFLRCVEKERDRIVKKKLCRMIAKFYNVLCIKTGWPQLIYFVKGCVLGYNDMLETAMLILGPLRLFIENHPMSLLVHYGYLEKKNSADIRIAAFGAAIGYIRCTYGVMDEHLVTAMTRVLTEGEKVTTQKAFELLFEWAHQIKHPSFSGYLFESYDTKLLSHLEEYFSGRQLVWFVRGAIEIAESQSLNIETRHLAINFVITLGEKGRYSDNELMINKLFGILMSDIENEAASQWAENKDDDACWPWNLNALMKFLDRLAFRVDKDSFNWPKLEQYLGASEWRKRVIAINILALAQAQISKVYLKVTNKNLDQLVTKVLDLCQDSHHRVRLAAINATRLLFTHFNPDLQFQYHSPVLPALAKAIYADPDRHVRSAAIGAIHKLSSNCDPDLPLPDPYYFFVLPALLEAICDFEYQQVQDDAFFAMINFSKNYPLDTSPYLRETVGTLLKTHASSWEILEEPAASNIFIRYLRKTVSFLLKEPAASNIFIRYLHEKVSFLLKLQRREDIDWHQTRISASEILLIKFKMRLPHDTWDSILSSLHPDQQAEFNRYMTSCHWKIRELFSNPHYFKFNDF